MKENHEKFYYTLPRACESEHVRKGASIYRTEYATVSIVDPSGEIVNEYTAFGQEAMIGVPPEHTEIRRQKMIFRVLYPFELQDHIRLHPSTHSIAIDGPTRIMFDIDLGMDETGPDAEVWDPRYHPCSPQGPIQTLIRTWKVFLANHTCPLPYEGFFDLRAVWSPDDWKTRFDFICHPGTKGKLSAHLVSRDAVQSLAAVKFVVHSFIEWCRSSELGDDLNPSSEEESISEGEDAPRQESVPKKISAEAVEKCKLELELPPLVYANVPKRKRPTSLIEDKDMILKMWDLGILDNRIYREDKSMSLRIGRHFDRGTWLQNLAVFDPKYKTYVQPVSSIDPLLFSRTRLQGLSSVPGHYMRCYPVRIPLPVQEPPPVIHTGTVSILGNHQGAALATILRRVSAGNEKALFSAEPNQPEFLFSNICVGHACASEEEDGPTAKKFKPSGMNGLPFIIHVALNTKQVRYSLTRDGNAVVCFCQSDNDHRTTISYHEGVFTVHRKKKKI